MMKKLHPFQRLKVINHFSRIFTISKQPRDNRSFVCLNSNINLIIFPVLCGQLKKIEPIFSYIKENIRQKNIRATIKVEKIVDSTANLNLLVYLVKIVYFVSLWPYNKQLYIPYRRRWCLSAPVPEPYKPKTKCLCISMWTCDWCRLLLAHSPKFSTAPQDRSPVCSL